MVVTRHMKGTNRATIHHLNKEKLHMLTTHTGKQVNIFGFLKVLSIFYLILVMQIFMDFQNFANFCLVSCKVLKVVKIEFDTRYLSWGSSPKLASGSLLLVGIKPSPTVVGPPLLLGLLLLLLPIADPLTCVSLPVLS